MSDGVVSEFCFEKGRIENGLNISRHINIMIFFFGLLDVIEHSFALDSYKFLPIDFINVFITKEIVDGMEMVEFIMEIEDRFGVDIPDGCLSDLSTLGDLCKFIDNKLAVRL